MRRILSILLLGLATALAAWWGVNPFFDKIEAKEALPNTLVATLLKPSLALNEFSLIDTENKIFTRKSLMGQWTLMFFGYAQCPEVCPRALAMITELWRLVPEQKLKMQFVFVSLDPKNDTVEELHQFLGHFNPKFIGLTGSETEIKNLAKACRVYSYIEPKPNEKGQRVISHSDRLMLINPQGQLQALFSPPHEPEKIAKDLKTIIEKTGSL